ncbi:hypothetical protein [Deinococcus multiflagellatus]|uniref:Uncharacterized protein n=1 Tax=Deinococcus multiflagellatus TaxID=1656887 RepID=A0ABW1ZLB1_9DEIO
MRRLHLRLTLRAQLALWAALATGLAVALVAGGLYVAVSGFLRQAQAQRLNSAVEVVQGRVEDLLRPRRPGEGGPDDLLPSLLGVATVSQADLERIARAVDGEGLALRVVALQGANCRRWAQRAFRRSSCRPWRRACTAPRTARRCCW